MPLTISTFPADPECGGTQWVVANADQLATLVGTVLIGRARHAAHVLDGVQHNPTSTSAAQKEGLRVQLHPLTDGARWQRDGLLFEIICWICAKKTAAPGELISDPHLSSTQQGVDTLYVRFDPAARTISLATICEQKCTTNARTEFRTKVIPAFKEWISGKRDNQLTSISIGLLSVHNLTDAEQTAIFDKLVQSRPLAFRAALTVTPALFEKERCVAVFKDYKDLTPAIDNRLGDTFPLADVRQWFQEFSDLVWQKIEAEDV
jgi:hypothetical protein